MKHRAPFRADHVGSLLRPAAVKKARQDRHEGRISATQLRALENECIRDLVRKQEDVGLQAVTDGEIRRAYWHFDFLAGLDGVELIPGKQGIQFHGMQTKADSIVVTGKVGFPQDHPMLEDFRYLSSTTRVMPKMTIPSPTVLHFRGGRKNINREVYPTLDTFFDDTAAAFAEAIRAFYAAGCRYLQLDDTVWAYLCSEQEKQAARERGDDPEGLAEIYARMINTALQARPADMVVTTHVCRGNFRSSWIAEGGYEPVARILLQGTDYDAYFLEYDSDRAGGFEPLRFLPKGDKQVVLGLVTSKTGLLEDTGLIKRRVEEACRYADIDQFCLSPQCGFASTEEGNLISEEEQWEKLRLVVKIAGEVWNK
ncbi:MAG: 5-methyltetrahydropteroyltriglutamate--homocysteine S-methyltransferase [Gammaproteobacteria bacterium]|nr:MAG: 5-methyltetrahydropteroyltriglutamate--homocysteine S-methyltransferase [Gammaproteobacteria bacterium]